MNKHDKSIKLAELMGWDVFLNCNDKLVMEGELELQLVNPYSDNDCGKAQFTDILMKFPEIIIAFTNNFTCDCCAADCPIWTKEPTQENILDEILRMNGVYI